MPIKLQGKEYVTHEELVTWATDAGLRSVSTALLHFSVSPPEAIVQATAEGERGTFQGLGDCLPEVRGNVGRMVSAHWIRMAETRAVNRALRLYTGRATTSLDELGDRGESGSRRPELDSPLDDLRADIKALLDGKPYDLRHVVAHVFDVGPTREEAARSWNSVDDLRKCGDALGKPDAVKHIAAMAAQEKK